MRADPVKIALFVGGVAAVVMLISVAVVLFHNGQSRNLALGAGTLGAAIVLVVTQAWFELRAPLERDAIGITFTIDRGARAVRQWRYPNGGAFFSTGLRPTAELRGSDFAARANPDVFEGADSGVSLATHMVWYSVVQYLASSQFDWQIDVRPFGTSPGGYRFRRVSEGAACTIMTERQLQALLEAARNLYAPAGVQLFYTDLCFPPRTPVRLTPDGLTVENPFARIGVAITAGLPLLVHPETRQRENLPSGQARYEEHPFGLTVTTSWSGLRAHSSDLPKYREWANRFRGGLREWFQGPAESPR